ncbi:heparinase II/III-family protein [Horticoccus luteus]|uniref:Heparinase II/III-family protein n=1 Tax=Horticoccus luteus TaxID=2862869 RepID=A0A8F9XKB2_9BACT|nr:heparinase II/III family protein [Horticoccus luteus]QYM77904.1 heparinase II/III-family protein [Horticoccus luteus]
MARILRTLGLSAALGAGAAALAAHTASDWKAEGEPRPPLPVGVVLPAVVRTPAFPLKDARTLFTEAEIAQARENVARYPAAQAVAAELKKEADYWAAWSDEALRDVVTSAEVPRAFDCSTEGCPVHGKKIFEVTQSTYPWIIDPKQPFKVTCPIGGESYPSNDYGKFYRSGFKDRSDFNGPYVDDGRGWVSPTGERYWFVAHANHWTWYWHPQADHHALIKAAESLGRTYLLTGEEVYAHKAAVLLARIAEVYPAMDYESQSRYGEILAAQHHERYVGKVVNAIWESYLVAQFAECYDAIWPTIDGDAALQKLYGKNGRDLRALIDANLLEEGIDAYYSKKTRGNYGMHQRSLLVLATVRQHGDNARYVRDVLDRPDGTMYLGLRFALYNLIWQDGQPYESPDYNATWISNLTAVAGLLPKLGRTAVEMPRLRRLLDAPLDLIAVGNFTPTIGDTGTVYGGIAEENTAAYQWGYRTYREPRFARFLAGTGAGGAAGFKTFESLLHPVIASPARGGSGGRVMPPQASRLISGYGVSLLNNAADTIGLSLYHGLHVTHFHYDRLNLELFAEGQPLLPDLGYPDGMNEMVPGLYAWSINTISHNTVTVDAAKAPGNVAGVVELQADGGWARAVAVSAPGTYPQCDVYRRTTVMVDADATHSYLVDVFDVRGGRQHDYSLHGPPGTFALAGGSWTEPARGTLAGEDVAVGEIYDDPVLGAKGYKGGYADYMGSGFQYLTHVQRLRAGEAVLDYTHEKSAAACVRIRLLAGDGQDVILAQARVSPVKWPQVLHYAIMRNKPAGPGARAVTSRFVSVIEPFESTPSITAAERIELPNGVGVKVQRANGETDVILVGEPGTRKQMSVGEHCLTSDARVVVGTLTKKLGWTRLWLADGTSAQMDGGPRVVARGWTGEVMAVDVKTGDVRVRGTDASQQVGVADLAGRIVSFGAGRRLANTVVGAKRAGGDVVLTLKDDVRLGLGQADGIAGKRVRMKTNFIRANAYRGATLMSAEGKHVGQVRAAGDDWFELAEAPAADWLGADTELWVVGMGAGDACEVPATGAWVRAER